MPIHYCWHCYHQVTADQVVCPHCGQATEPADRVDYAQRRIWALRHPLPDRRLLAAQTLGKRGDPTPIPALRTLINDPDPYVAAAALTSLVALAGLDGDGGAGIAELVHGLAEHAEAAPVRVTARRLLRPGTAEDRP